MKMNNRKEFPYSITERKVNPNVCYRTPEGGEVSLEALFDPGELGGGAPPAPPAGAPAPAPAGTPAPAPAETPEAKAAREATEAQTALKTKHADLIAGLTGDFKIEEKDGVVNVVDSTGKVVKTTAPTPPAAPVAVEVDGVKYQLDKDGNALNQDGTTFKTKAELDALENPEEPLIVELAALTGFKPVGDDGKPKVYADTNEGLLEFINDLAANKAQAAEKELFTTFPKAEAYIRHIAAGGTDESFFNHVRDDYSKVTIDDNNVEQQKQILRNYYIKKGFTPEKADKTVKYHEQANELLPEAKDALADMKQTQAKADAAKKAADDAAIAKKEQEANDYWKGVEEIVTKGTVQGIIIPEADRKNFLKYVSEAVTNDRMSQAALDASKESVETKLYLDLLRFKKYNIADLVKAAVATEKVRSLRSKVAGTKIPVATQGGTGGSSAGTGGAAPIVSLDNLL